MPSVSNSPNMTLWDNLSPPWQCCLEEAWAAYRAGSYSYPIGAVVTDATGRVVARGRSRVGEHTAGERQLHGHPLAHAEINALIALDYNLFDPPHDCILYSANEPCPLCFGAFYMSGLRTLRYAGSATLLGTTPYLSRKKITIVGPEHADLETIVMAMHVEFELARGRPRTNVLIDTWDRVLPRAVEFDERLFQSGELRRLSEDGVHVSTVVDRLVVGAGVQ